MSGRPVIIDCDPGIDDAIALLLALASPEEIDLLGITCVAAPVLDEHDRAVAGVSVAGPVGRFQPARHVAAVQAAAAGIAATLARRAVLR